MIFRSIIDEFKNFLPGLFKPYRKLLLLLAFKFKDKVKSQISMRFYLIIPSIFISALIRTKTKDYFR